MALYMYGVLVVAVTTGLAIAGLFLARRLVPLAALRANNDVADPMVQVLGTLYAVVLGLLVVQAMERFEEARVTTEQEASALADTFRLATALPAELKQSLQSECLTYARAVIDEEWDAMQSEGTADRAWEAVDKMWWDIISFTPTTEREKFIYPSLLEAAKDLNDHRRNRLLTSKSWVPGILWAVLITGAATTIMSTYCFGFDSIKAQIFMVCLVAVTLSLNIYLWSIYSNPFYGLLRVEADAFVQDVQHFQFYLSHPDELRWHRRAAVIGGGGAPPVDSAVPGSGSHWITR